MGSKQIVHQRLRNDPLMEIFSRMPAKAVIKFSSLSKSLSTLVSDPLFVHTQTVFSSRFDAGLFIEPKFLKYFNGELESHGALGIPPESISFLDQNGVVLASSQGLLLVIKKCVRSAFKELLICNPVTRRCATIPIPDCLQPLLDKYWLGLVFECHPHNLDSYPTDFSDYTIVVPMWAEEDGIPRYSPRHKLIVYHNGRWNDETCQLKMELNARLNLLVSVGLFVGCDGGLVVHVLCQRVPHKDISRVYEEPYIVAYDINRKAQSRALKIPNGAWEVRDQCIHPWAWSMFKWRRRWSCSGGGDTIGLVRVQEMYRDCRLTLWVLEDYERCSWRRVLSKTIKEMGVPEKPNIDFNVVGCCVVNETVLAFSTWKQVYMYTMVGREAGRLELVRERQREFSMMPKLIPYANTLHPVCGGEESYGYDQVVCQEVEEESSEEVKEKSYV